MKLTSQLLLLATLVVPILLGAGCATPGYQQGDKTADSAQKASNKIGVIGGEIDAALAALADLTTKPAADLRPQFKTFTSAHDKLMASAKAIKSQTEAMNSRGATYFAQWDKELAKITSDDIRTRATDRRTAMADKFDRVKSSYEEVRANFVIVGDNLKDIRTLLNADLTRGGVRSIGDIVPRTQGEADKLKTALAKLANDYQALSVALSSQQPPEAPAKSAPGTNSK